MKKIFLTFILAILLVGNAFAATISKSFTAVGGGGDLSVKVGDSFSYTVSGTFSGTVVLQKSTNGGFTWETVTSKTAAATGTVVAESTGSNQVSYRFFCTTYTSGTIVTTITDEIMTPVQEFKNLNGVTVANTTETGMAINDLTITGNLKGVNNGTSTTPDGTGGLSFDGAGSLFIAGQQPSSNALANGVNATQSLVVLGAPGGNTTITTTGTGGKGSGIFIEGGAGGVANQADVASTGGTGGSIHLLGGPGGQAKGLGANVGGNGGDIIIEGGAIGIGTSGTSRSNGVAGKVYILGGVGDAATREDILMAMTPNGYRSGSVGIGTTGVIASTALVDTYINSNALYETISHNGSSGTASQFRISVQNNLASANNLSMVAYSSGSTVSLFGLTMANYTALFNSGGSTNGLIIATQGVAKPIIFGINATERMRIDSTGNIGVGTALPSTKLQVGGGFRIANGVASCFILDDTDGTGFTECCGNNGTLSCATDTDGIPDGSL